MHQRTIETNLINICSTCCYYNIYVASRNIFILFCTQLVLFVKITCGFYARFGYNYKTLKHFNYIEECMRLVVFWVRMGFVNIYGKCQDFSLNHKIVCPKETNIENRPITLNFSRHTLLGSVVDETYIHQDFPCLFAAVRGKHVGMAAVLPVGQTYQLQTFYHCIQLCGQRDCISSTKASVTSDCFPFLETFCLPWKCQVSRAHHNMSWLCPLLLAMFIPHYAARAFFRSVEQSYVAMEINLLQRNLEHGVASRHTYYSNYLLICNRGH